MSENPVQAASWPALPLTERRVLGVMVEKAKTTPDVYPLSLNALTTGCNQKSNRDPVLNLDDSDVEQALDTLQKQGLVTRITGGRVDRWRHNLYDVWKVEKIELAILAELFLRGAQTEGELRSHASRMEAIDDLEKLRGVLRPMAERGLVLFLGPEGRRGTLITHGFQSEQDLERLRASAAASAHEREAAPAPPRPAAPDLEAAVQDLRRQFEELRTLVQTLQNDFQQMKSEIHVVKP